jgi:hypothetical protein
MVSPEITRRSLAEIVRLCPAISQLVLSNCPMLQGQDLVELASLRALRTFMWVDSGQVIDESALLGLCHCISLVHLELLPWTTTNFSGHALEAIAKACPRLARFSLYECGDTPGHALEALCASCHLEELHLDEVRLSDSELSRMLEYSRRTLRSLSLLAVQGFSPRALANSLGLCTSLRELHLDSSVISSNDHLSLFFDALPHLLKFTLYGASFPDCRIVSSSLVELSLSSEEPNRLRNVHVDCPNLLSLDLNMVCLNCQ